MTTEKPQQPRPTTKLSSPDQHQLNLIWVVVKLATFKDTLLKDA